MRKTGAFFNLLTIHNGFIKFFFKGEKGEFG